MDRDRIVKEEAIKLYIMAHQRYILTEAGLDKMVKNKQRFINIETKIQES